MRSFATALRDLMIVLACASVVAVSAWALRSEPSRSESSPETAAGGAAGCYRCHLPEEAPPGVHAPVPCQGCHLGDVDGLNVLSAHRGLEREPGALDTAERTCGACHVEELRRVRLSMMATARGLVAVDRWVLGERPSPDGDQEMSAVLAQTEPSPAQDHVRRLCAGCHLGTRRDNRDDAIAGRASGCSACHSRAAAGAAHPPVGGPVAGDACLGCHSRSSRISLSYRGRYEATGDMAGECERVEQLPDGRRLCAAPADLHHEAGLECVDCHLHSELMGDGEAHAHQEDAVELRCESCHGGDSSLETTWGQVDDEISHRLVRLYGDGARPPGERVRTGADGTPVYNLRPKAAGWELRRKSGDSPPLEVQQMRREDHDIGGHSRLACVACHARWAPTCPTCHTDFAPEDEQWDFGHARAMPGRFRERSEGVGRRMPALGVREDGTIWPAIPGMVGTLDLRAAGGTRVSTRLYSLLDPHTTGRSARSCEDCHRSPWALGLGAGRFEAMGDTLRFIPGDETDDGDGFAPGAWTVVGARVPGRGTRRGARSLDAGELERAMRVGACLGCHAGADAIFRDFPAARARLGRGEALSCGLSSR